MMAKLLFLVALAVCSRVGEAFLPSQNPPWAPTYDLALSSITMVANFSGWFDSTLAHDFGIVSFDWSNNKAHWAANKPMSCEEDLLTQAEEMKKVSPATHVGVYRNLVKALPWYTSVREKLLDPAYAGWFLRFNANQTQYFVPNCNGTNPPNPNNPVICSVFYHDQEQTPEVPTPSDPHPDGSCVDFCDCGSTVPCGEYLWDHRNASLRSWLLDSFILGPTGLGSEAVDFLFIDDFWCSDAINGSCTDPVQGPSEINKYNQQDMGLSDSDVTDLTEGWLKTMTMAQDAIVSAGAYTWSLFEHQANANASPVMIDSASCAAKLRDACTTSHYHDVPLVMGVTPGADTHPFPYVTQEVAAFLIMRQDYAYLGWGQWGQSWPFSNKALQRPAVMTTDVGTPSSACTESSPGVFTRSYTKASIVLDCNRYYGSITP